MINEGRGDTQDKQTQAGLANQDTHNQQGNIYDATNEPVQRVSWQLSLHEVLGRQGKVMEQVNPTSSKSYENSETAPWGDHLLSITSKTTMQIVYQNVNGINQSNPLTNYMLDNLEGMKCGVLCASETNANW